MYVAIQTLPYLVHYRSFQTWNAKFRVGVTFAEMANSDLYLYQVYPLGTKTRKWVTLLLSLNVPLWPLTIIQHLTFTILLLIWKQNFKFYYLLHLTLFVTSCLVYNLRRVRGRETLMNDAQNQSPQTQTFFSCDVTLPNFRCIGA